MNFTDVFIFEITKDSLLNGRHLRNTLPHEHFQIKIKSKNIEINFQKNLGKIPWIIVALVEKNIKKG